MRELFVPCYIVEHARGRLRWDGGLPLKIAEAPGGRAEMEGYGLSYHRSIVDQLADMQLAPADISYAALSHLHFDHVGAAGAFPAATVLMQRTDWDHQTEAGRAPVFNSDAAETFRSMDKVDALLQQTGATLWIEHEKALADTLKKAPEYYD